VDVIAHQDVGVNGAFEARGVLAQPPQEGQPVALAKKALGVFAPTANHVQRNPRGMGNK